VAPVAFMAPNGSFSKFHQKVALFQNSTKKLKIHEQNLKIFSQFANL